MRELLIFSSKRRLDAYRRSVLMTEIARSGDTIAFDRQHSIKTRFDKQYRLMIFNDEVDATRIGRGMYLDRIRIDADCPQYLFNALAQTVHGTDNITMIDFRDLSIYTEYSGLETVLAKMASEKIAIQREMASGDLHEIEKRLRAEGQLEMIARLEGVLDSDGKKVYERIVKEMEDVILS
jgi:hypothetical protein